MSKKCQNSKNQQTQALHDKFKEAKEEDPFDIEGIEKPTMDITIKQNI